MKMLRLVIIGVVVFFIVVLVSSSFVTRRTDQLVDDKYILSCDIGDDQKVVARLMNTQGRDRKNYDYYLVLHGDHETLLEFVNKLGVDEVGDVMHSDWKERTPRPALKWWNPPSLSGKKEYRAFQKNVGVKTSEACFCRIRIELSDADLFLTKAGNLNALIDEVRYKGIKCRLFSLFCGGQL